MTLETTTRGVVMVDGRAVHYRSAGHGPVVVALHGSPESAKALEPVMSTLADRFTVVALDTPGNGDSDALRHPHPQSSDYADALIATLDALGLKRVSLYGFHTGAGTAMETAVRAPDRVASVVLDGYAIWTDAERAVFLSEAYLTPFTPSSDGSHLAALWSRVEEQSVFFPYYDHTDAARLDMDLPPLHQQQRRALDWLNAGDAYRAPYRAAFERRGGDSLKKTKVPTLLSAAPTDPLALHLDRVTDPSPCLTVERWPDRPTGFARAKDFFSAHSSGCCTTISDGPATADEVQRGFIGKLHWRGRLSGDGRPLLLLHDAGGSSRLYAPALADIARARPVVAVDLPGHGLSEEEVAPADWAAAVSEWMGAVGLDRPAIAGFHLGGVLAVQLAARGGASAAGLIGAPIYTPEEASDRLAHYAPSLEPVWDGSHLLRAWRMLRRQAMFHPWYATTRAARTDRVGSLDVPVLHRRHVDLMRSAPVYQTAYAAQHAVNLGADLEQAGKATLFRLNWDPLSTPERMAALTSHADVKSINLADAPSQWAHAFADWAT